MPPLTVGYGNDKTQTTGRTDRQQLAGQLEEQSVEGVTAAAVGFRFTNFRIALFVLLPWPIAMGIAPWLLLL